MGSKWLCKHCVQVVDQYAQCVTEQAVRLLREMAVGLDVPKSVNLEAEPKEQGTPEGSGHTQTSGW